MKKLFFLFTVLLFSNMCFAQEEETESVPASEAATTVEVEEKEEEPASDTESDTTTESEAPAEIEASSENDDTAETAEIESPVESDSENLKATKGGISKIPASKRPKAIDKEKAEKAAEKDESEKDYENKVNTIKYGLPSEISTLIDELIKNDDPRFTEEIYDVFQASKNPSIKQKVLNYFKQQEDPCLEDFAVEVLNDPYDQKGDIVKACFQYISAMKTKEAIFFWEKCHIVLKILL